MTTFQPVCFVLMPFGTKSTGSGATIDFDDIYDKAIRPAIEAAGMEPVRADEERVGGIIHKTMFERLLICEYAVADLTTANANVFYELGVRHAARPASTVAIFATQQQMPFDVNHLRALPYALGEDHQLGASEAHGLRSALTELLQSLRNRSANPLVDSPLFTLIPDYTGPEIAHIKTDVFRERLDYANHIKTELTHGRDQQNIAAIAAVEERFGTDLADVEIGVLVDLYLSYRAVSCWERMVALYHRMPAELKALVMVREQLGFALNRLGDRKKATRVLKSIIVQHGASSETCGILGRVYKDQWMDARSTDKTIQATGYLSQAIKYYLKGFEADWRDAYPGINAVTLLDIQGDDDSLEQKQELIPLVTYAVKQRLRGGSPDYWDHATLLELAILANDHKTAAQHLSSTMISARYPWERETTANNLGIIYEARKQRDEETDWLEEIIAVLKEG